MNGKTQTTVLLVALTASLAACRTDYEYSVQELQPVPETWQWNGQSQVLGLTIDAPENVARCADFRIDPALGETIVWTYLGAEDNTRCLDVAQSKEWLDVTYLWRAPETGRYTFEIEALGTTQRRVATRLIKSNYCCAADPDSVDCSVGICGEVAAGGVSSLTIDATAGEWMLLHAEKVVEDFAVFRLTLVAAETVAEESDASQD